MIKKSLKNKTNFKNLKNKKAQVSIEMIVILSVLILGSVILASILFGFIGSKTDQATDIDNKTDATLDNFLTDLTNYNDNNYPQDPVVSATNYNLILLITGNGTVITSGLYASGSSVPVNAIAGVGFTFYNWTDSNGSVVSSNANYSFNMPSNDYNLTANFIVATSITYILNVSRNGTGTGIVTSSPTGIDCGTDCFQTYDSGTSVTLTAVTSAGSSFTGWSGACSGIGTCIVNMNANKNVVANFSAVVPTYNLTLAKNPTSVSAILAGDGNYPSDTPVSVSVSVTTSLDYDLGYSFVNWTDLNGSVSSNEYFTYTMPAQATTLTANFSTIVPTYLFTLNKLANWSGNLVISTPEGINCGTSTPCTANFPVDSTVIFTRAEPWFGYVTTWGGDCAAATTDKNCTLVMDSAKTASIDTDYITYPFNLKVIGNGNVYGLGGAINCPLYSSNCTGNYPRGINTNPNSFLITATPKTGNYFSGWSGDCASYDTNLTCTVVMDSNQDITATFLPTTTCNSLIVEQFCSGSDRILLNGFCSISYCEDICEAGGYSCCEWNLLTYYCWGSYSNNVSTTGSVSNYANSCN